MPVDPVSDGTWIGASDAGLAAVLLNAYPAENSATDSARTLEAGLTSRGTLIPALLASDSFDDLLGRASQIDASRFAPFRLVLADRSEVAELHWARPAPVLQARLQFSGPTMFTSSGLGDIQVDGPRRRLFDGWFHAAAEWPVEQDAFHRHQWPESAPELSVCMSRAEAKTRQLHGCRNRTGGGSAELLSRAAESSRRATGCAAGTGLTIPSSCQCRLRGRPARW